MKELINWSPNYQLQIDHFRTIKRYLLYEVTVTVTFNLYQLEKEEKYNFFPSSTIFNRSKYAATNSIIKG